MGNSIVFTPTVRQLLSLVRASLWQNEVDMKPFTDYPVDWKATGKVASQQTVAVLVLHSAFTLSTEYLPPKEWIHKAYLFIERNRRTHLLLNRCLVEATTKLKEAGFRPVLLKGQAYSRVYTNPTLRQCGDIDLYIGKRDYFPAYKATRQFGWKSIDSFNAEGKHYSCELNGIHLELHRVAAHLHIPKINRRFQEWTIRQLENKNLPHITTGGKEISIPSPIFNVIFVFVHLYHHFINGGIGLRQICDWIMLLHFHSNDIDHKELEIILRELQLLKVWRYFASIAVEHLGLMPSECPFYIKGYSFKSNKILSIILKEGNFGRYAQAKSPRPDGYLPGKLYSFLQNSLKMLSRVQIDPHNVIRAYGNYVSTGLKVVISDIIKKL